MLVELAVRNLGVIEELRVVLEPGMTALTGETGAGKTLVVTALQLLLGARADPSMVRDGSTEASVEGRFVLDGEEVVLRRVVPSVGRSRAYVNGALATAATLAEAGADLVDLYGQHDHHVLAAPSAQRRALDRFAELDLGPLLAARDALAACVRRQEALGGDIGARARELDLLRFQLDELRVAAVEDADEELHLAAEEERLADAQGHREAAEAAHLLLGDDGGAAELAARAAAHLSGRAPLGSSGDRVRSMLAELRDLSSELRVQSEEILDDPVRLDEVRVRRNQLLGLRRKYGNASLRHEPESVVGEPTLEGVMRYTDAVTSRIAELSSAEEQLVALDDEIAAARARVSTEEAGVAAARAEAAPRLAAAVEAELRALAMPAARVAVAVEGPGAADEVAFLLAANPGMPLQPLAKVASGGELARAMLALRLVLTEAPPTMVFDEVDAGIGGEAAVVVGQALARLGEARQVLVVTHLPQVASAARSHVGVVKQQTDGTTTTSVHPLVGEARVVELSRMLSGSPDSDVAHEHARELLGVHAHEALS